MGKSLFGRWGMLVLVLLTLLLIFGRFPDFFKYGNSRVIEPWGDGYKSYITILYHIKYDSTYSHFEGMNYPYGEHVIPADTQPLISNAVRFISRNVVDLYPYALGIINFSLLLGVFLCALFLYLIFQRLKLPDWYSMVVALGLTFLSPQLARIAFHYGLGHPEVLVIVLYLLLRFDEKMHWKWSLWMAFVVWAFANIHFYYFAIMAFTIGGFFFFRYVRKREWSKLPTYALHFGIQLIVPLIFFVFWMYYNDPSTDRTKAPWGFFAYRAFPEGVFYFPELPHFKWIDQHLVHLRHVGVESQSYIGLVSIIVLLIILFPWLKKLMRRPAIGSNFVQQDFLNNIFYTGIAIALFAFGLPFILPGFDALLDYAGPIRQFRSIGRFAWVFYYTTGIVAFTWLFYWAIGGWRLRKWILLLAIVVLGIEAYWNADVQSFDLDKIEEFAPGKAFTEVTDINYDQFQAIVPIPYYNIGSDNFWWHLSGFIGQKSETLTLQTGLPTTGAMLTRTSLGQTLNQIQLVTEPYRIPRILSDFPNQKPLLLLWDENRHDEKHRNYEHLREGLQPIFRKEELLFYDLPLEHFNQRIEQRKRAITQIIDSTALFSSGDLLKSDSLAQFVYQKFDDQSADKTYRGNGAFQAAMEEKNTIYEGPLPTAENKGQLISFWMFLEQDLYPRTEILLEEVNPTDGAVLQEVKAQCREWLTVFDNNGWALLEHAFMPQQEGSSLRITLQNEALGKAPLWVDELLIRPDSLQLYQQSEKELFKNNRWYSR